MNAGWFKGMAVVILGVGALSQWCFLGPVKEETTAHVFTIPHALGGWLGEDVALEERTYEILETRQVLYRQYRLNPQAPPIDLCVVLSEANRKASHPPEVCYIGSGAHVDRHPAARVQFASLKGPTALPANVLLVRRGQYREVTLYWYLAGSRLMTNYYSQQLAILWSQLLGRPSQGALIRVSTPIVDESPEQAIERLKFFIGPNLPVVLDNLV